MNTVCLVYLHCCLLYLSHHPIWLQQMLPIWPLCLRGAYLQDFQQTGQKWNEVKNHISSYDLYQVLHWLLILLKIKSSTTSSCAWFWQHFPSLLTASGFLTIPDMRQPHFAVGPAFWLFHLSGMCLPASRLSSWFSPSKSHPCGMLSKRRPPN